MEKVRAENNVNFFFLFFFSSLLSFLFFFFFLLLFFLRTGRPKQFGIVFSLNMLVALVFQNITQFLVGKQAFNLSPTSQYVVYAFIFFGISVGCLIWLLWLRFARKNSLVVVEKYPTFILLFFYFYFTFILLFFSFILILLLFYYYFILY